MGAWMHNLATLLLVTCISSDPVASEVAAPQEVLSTCRCYSNQPLEFCAHQFCSVLHVESGRSDSVQPCGLDNSVVMSLPRPEKNTWALSSVRFPAGCDLSEAILREDTEQDITTISRKDPAGRTILEIPLFDRPSATAQIKMPMVSHQCLTQKGLESVVSTFSRIAPQSRGAEEQGGQHNMIYVVALAGALVYSSL